MGNWTEDDHMSPEQEKLAWEKEWGMTIEALDDCRCGRCGNPIPRRIFVNPKWERCERCSADERNEDDMSALRRTVTLKRSQGRKW